MPIRTGKEILILLAMAAGGRTWGGCWLGRLKPIQNQLNDLKDPIHLWINRYYALPVVLLGLLLLALGGWPFVTWGLFLRTVLGLHATWLVNSATHLWGTRRFATRDDSRNNWWVAMLTFGEGWHNNHHAHPASARHGLAWYEIDLNWLGIRTLQLFGLAKSVQLIRIKDPIPPAKAAVDAPEEPLLGEA